MPHTSDNGGEGRGTYDALVIGAGVVGLACAWRAAAAGLSVCVLERDRPAAGASGVAAGMLAPVGEVSWGEERLLRANLASAAAWPAFAAELGERSGQDVGYRPRGALHLALDRDEAEELRRRHELQCLARPRRRVALADGLPPSRARPGDVCRRRHPRPRRGRGRPACDRRGARRGPRPGGGELITGDEPAEAITSGERIEGVRTRAGRELRAGSVVLASGAWSGEAGWLSDQVRPPVRPVKGQILVLRGPEPACERIVCSRWVYLVPRPDGRLVVGATVEERGFDTTVTAGGVHELLREAYRLLPEVAELEIEEMTAGLRPGSPDNAPIVGAGRLDGLVLATGHYRNGILLAPLTAEAVVAHLTGGAIPDAAAGLAPQRFEREGTPA